MRGGRGAIRALTRFYQSRYLTSGSPRVVMAANQLKLARRIRSVADMLSLTSYKGSVDSSGGRAQVIIPGLVLDDFDRTGHLSLVRLQRLLSLSRIFVYHLKNEDTGVSFLEYDTLTTNQYTFMASTETSVKLDFYQIPTSSTLPRLGVNIRLGYVGTSSLNSVAELVDLDTGKVFATNTNQVVMVDKTTRKSTVIPDWWKEKYKHCVIDDRKLVVSLIPPPDGDKCYYYDVKVSWNDIDGYKHTNYLSYVRFCIDAAMDGAVNGHLSKLKDDILGYHGKQMRISYKGESLAGQALLVKYWENETNPYMLHFDISRDSVTIFQNTIEFHEPENQNI